MSPDCVLGLDELGAIQVGLEEAQERLRRNEMGVTVSVPVPVLRKLMEVYSGVCHDEETWAAREAALAREKAMMAYLLAQMEGFPWEPPS